MKKLKSRKESIFALIESTSEYRALQPGTKLNDFFLLQRGALKPSIERGLLKKIYVRDLLMKLKSEDVPTERAWTTFVKNNGKYKKDLYELIKDDVSSLKQATNDGRNSLHLFFIDNAHKMPGLFGSSNKSLMDDMKKQLRKLEEQKKTLPQLKGGAP